MIQLSHLWGCVKQAITEDRGMISVVHSVPDCWGNKLKHCMGEDDDVQIMLVR